LSLNKLLTKRIIIRRNVFRLEGWSHGVVLNIPPFTFLLPPSLASRCWIVKPSSISLLADAVFFYLSSFFLHFVLFFRIACFECATE
jgi:hypothetical protein